jgi:hypothetical protein
MIYGDPAWLAPSFVWRTGVLNPTGTKQILWQNLSRVAILFVQNGGTVHIWTDNTIGPSAGINITSGGLPVILKFSDLGPVVGGEWWANQTSVNALQWIEVIFQPKQET